MWVQLLVQCGAILWVVQAAYARGYGAASGISNGHGPQPNGNHPPNSGVGRFLLPSKGVGAQSGYGGYPTKGVGYGAAAGVAHGTKGYGAAAGGTNGYGGKPHAYGAQAGPVNGPRLKGNGHGAQAGQGTKAYGAALGVNGAKQNGHGAAASAQYGLGTKGNGQGAVTGSSNNFGARPGQGQSQHKPMKGYGRPPHGSVKGPGVGMGAFRGLGVPQFARNPGKAYSRNSYSGHGAQPAGGYNGAYGPAGWGLGSQYGQKGPQQGYSGAAAGPNGQYEKPKGYGNVPSGFGAKQKGYGGAARPQTGAGAGVPQPHGAKPNGYGLALGGYGRQPNGYGAGSKPQTTKGLGAVSPSQGAKTLGTGYNGAAGVQNRQVARAASSGYGMLPNGKATKTTGASNDPTLYVLSPEQLNPALLDVVPQPAISQGSAPAAPEPTSGVLVRVTPEQHHNLLSPVPHGKTYKQPLEASLEPLPVLMRGKGPKPAPQSTPEAVHMGPEGPAAVFTQGNPPPGPAVVLPEGYVTGSAVPEQKGVEEVFGVDRTAKGDAAPESTEVLKTRAVPELASAKGTGSITPEETLTLGEANTKTQPEAGPDRLGLKGLPAGETGAMGIGGGSVKGWGAEPSKPDCDPSVPNGQWMKIPRPGLKAGAEASAGTITKGYSASAGGYPNGGAANKPAFGAGGFSPPGLVPGYGAGLGYPYAGKPKQPGYGQGANLGVGYENGYSHKGYGNGFRAGVQPDYASLGQFAPSVDGRSGGADQSPYNGAQMVPAGLDGLSQFEPQSAGLGLNGKLSGVYGGMSHFPFGGQTLGAEKTNGKYGIGGLQFAGQAFSSGGNGAAQYGGLGAGFGGVPGKYGYGRLAYPAHPVALGPEMKSTGKYGLPASPYQPEHPGLGHGGKLGKYGGAEVAPQALGGEAKPSGKYDNQGEEQLQPRDSTSEGRSNGQYGTAGLPYQPLPVAPDSAGKPYGVLGKRVKGEVPAPASAAGGEGDGYDNVGYINGQVQPEVVAFSPTLAYPSVPSYLTGESQLASDATPEAGTASLSLDAAPATETQGELQAPEQPDELLQQQLPRQIHIQQHLKLHFHPKTKSWRGANNEKHDLKGFFGNSGSQG